MTISQLDVGQSEIRFFPMLRNTRAQNLSNEYTFTLGNYDYIQSFEFFIRFSTGKQT